MLLPAEAKTELVQARSALDNAARTWLWGALFVVWTPWTWLALPIAIVVPAVAYYIGVLTAAADAPPRPASRDHPLLRAIALKLRRGGKQG